MNFFLFENIETLIFFYLFLINIISVIIFYLDKKKSIKNNRRISENTLHLLEILGGIFTIIFMIYIIRHKNKKIKYYSISYFILFLYIFLIYYYSTRIF